MSAPGQYLTPGLGLAGHGAATVTLQYEYKIHVRPFQRCDIHFLKEVNKLDWFGLQVRPGHCICICVASVECGP